MIDADNCPHPEEGLFHPRRMVAYENAVREMFFARYDGDPVLFVVVQPSFDVSYLVALDRQRLPPIKPAIEQSDGFSIEQEPPRYRYKLRVIRARQHVWANMMEEMQRQQGSSIRLGEAEQKRALAGAPLATTEQARDIDGAFADKLLAVWKGVLQRTQFVQEILTSPDGRQIIMARHDGTTYNFYANDMTAESWSPAKGSLLADFVVIVERLAKLPQGKGDRAAAQEIIELSDGLLARLTKNEPCLKPYQPD